MNHMNKETRFQAVKSHLDEHGMSTGVHEVMREITRNENEPRRAFLERCNTILGLPADANWRAEDIFGLSGECVQKGFVIYLSPKGIDW